MNLISGLRLTLDDLMRRFGTQIDHFHASQPNELYLHTKLDMAGAICSALYKKHKGRLAGVFAEDARSGEGVYHVYYHYTLDSIGGFILVRVPISADRPEMK